MISYLRTSAIALGRGLVMVALALAQVPVALLVLMLLALQMLGLVFLLRPNVRLTRKWTRLARRVTHAMTGIEIAEPYRPEPPPPVRRPDGWYSDGDWLYKTPRVPAFNRWYKWILKDPATWRDLAWLILYPVTGGPLAAAPAVLMVYGALQLAQWRVPIGVAAVLAGVVIAPWTLKAVGLSTALLLAPTKKTRLDGQVRRLTATRTEVVDFQAAELRRIERDLHDGTQARLVAVGMTLGAAERLIDTDPAAAIALIDKAQEASSTALAELRQLVRGIRPPVLAERGLAEALRALAVDSPLDVTVTGRMDRRYGDAVEAVVYFAVSELLTNAARHGRATRVNVEVTRHEDTLTVTVTDNGTGGADPAGGSGLRGIERRLSTVSGTFTLDSPPGGPTVARLRVPAQPVP